MNNFILQNCSSPFSTSIGREVWHKAGHAGGQHVLDGVPHSGQFDGASSLALESGTFNEVAGEGIAGTVLRAQMALCNS